MFSFFKKRRRQRLRTQPFPSAWLSIIKHNVSFYNHLPQADQQELQGHIQIFLAEKLFEGCGGLELTDEIKVTIAAQACLLLLHRETDYYPRLITILVYPHAYLAKGAVSIGGGAVLASETARLGEAWKDALVVLSWDDVRQGASDLHDGHNVVLHEFAHQLDQQDGSADGAPILEQPVRNLGLGVERGLRAIAPTPSTVTRMCSTNTAQPTPPSSSPWQPNASLKSRFRYGGSTRSFTRNSRSTTGKIRHCLCLLDG
jgi:Mlc titration factor MtfA (ptsG expression regulator)